MCYFHYILYLAEREFYIGNLYYYCYCKNNLECEHKIEKLVVRKTKFDIDLLKTHNKRIFSTKEEAEEELRKIKEEELRKIKEEE